MVGWQAGLLAGRESDRGCSLLGSSILGPFPWRRRHPLTGPRADTAVLPGLGHVCPRRLCPGDPDEAASGRVPVRCCFADRTSAGSPGAQREDCSHELVRLLEHGREVLRPPRRVLEARVLRRPAGRGRVLEGARRRQHPADPAGSAARALRRPRRPGQALPAPGGGGGGPRRPRPRPGRGLGGGRPPAREPPRHGAREQRAGVAGAGRAPRRAAAGRGRRRSGGEGAARRGRRLGAGGGGGGGAGAAGGQDAAHPLAGGVGGRDPEALVRRSPGGHAPAAVRCVLRQLGASSPEAARGALPPHAGMLRPATGRHAAIHASGHLQLNQ
mmetsp:Transcript_15557/g.49852  ORF Transcript_15557/g.49852 Transcript_15557/m.49852 type:complete len:328 (+) Transcript_15557:939-1922(+)